MNNNFFGVAPILIAWYYLAAVLPQQSSYSSTAEAFTTTNIMAVVFFIFAICVGGLMYLLPTAISLRNIRRHAATKTSVPAGYPREKGIAADYSDVFPPSRAHITSPTSTVQTTSVTSNPASSAAQLLKMSDDYRTADPSAYIFSGFTVGQIRALGSFPDYATLSGVPLPSPLKDFRIESAAPRPYRPFRWPYHQTMCR